MDYGQAIWGSHCVGWYKKITQLHIPVSQISLNKLQGLLQVLTAKYSLTDEEIAKCFFKRNTKLYLPFLAV